MHQAVLITAYTNVGHLHEIIDYMPDAFLFYIHIDKKSSIKASDITELRKKRNVVFISQKYDVNWGGTNHLKAILLLLEVAFEESSNNYFHLITGHDFPIKSPDEITAYLHENAGKEFMEYNRLPYDAWRDEDGGYDRILYYNMYDCFDGRKGFKRSLMKKLIVLQKKLRIRRSLPKDFPSELYGGSTYWTLSRKSIEYVFNYLKNNSSFLKRFKYTFCSEEIFFQTIILNSPLKNNVVNNSKRFIVWEERNGNYPANLDKTDLKKIQESDAFFARKFEYPVSKQLLEQIKELFKEGK